MCLIRAVCDNSMSIKQAEDTFDIGYVNAKKIINIFKEQNKTQKEKKAECSSVILTKSILNKLENYISENPALTFRDLEIRFYNSNRRVFKLEFSQCLLLS
ncbi:hypothetical protein CDIK_3582 [Cucumispora dikerogammari]|nr:hypothetical protein CDIK_3582 [Cucumispora dikerogammari]